MAEWFALIAGAAGAVAGAGYLARGLYRFAVKLDRINELVARELTHNHGSSMKDDVHGIAVALGETQRTVGQLADDVDTARRAMSRLAAVSAKHHPDDWPHPPNL